MARKTFPVTPIAVHNAIREFLPNALPLIRQVIQLPNGRTMEVDKRGTLFYSQDFVDDNLIEKGRICPKCMSGIIAHEVMHLVFNHFLKNEDPHLNLAADMVINSFITRTWPKQTGNGKIFRKYYSKSQDEKLHLLRPGGKQSIRQSAHNFYHRVWVNGDLPTPDVIASIRSLFPEPCPNIKDSLLGGHNLPSNNSDMEDEEWAEAIEKTVEDMKRRADYDIRNGGPGSDLLERMINVPITKRQIQKREIEKMVARKHVAGFMTKGVKRSPATSIMPTYMSRTDMVMIGAGLDLTRYHSSHKIKGREEGEGSTVYLYLDVSGSMSNDLPEIIATLRPLKGSIEKCFIFSTEVHECLFDELLSGIISTTGGTSFTIVGEHIIKEGIKKAIIITDGHDSFTNECIDSMKAFGITTITMCYHTTQIETNPWKEFGDVITLGDEK